jgi:hypothetical protein
MQTEGRGIDAAAISFAQGKSLSVFRGTRLKWLPR